LPEGSELELRSGEPASELVALAEEGVRTLLLEGGPTLAASFFAADLVDKLLVFFAPKLAGAGPGPVAALPEPLELARLSCEDVGEDFLLTAYVHEP
jgi:diaminohydroxyphosphoribosylaminopyrimidine deaminase/5-amino-6-(5-phosphoribosylamino)uracil reductase